MAKRILVIEDEKEIAGLIRERLIDSGFEVDVTFDGYQGVAFAHSRSPDLIVMDYMLPAGDGLSVLNKLQTSIKTRYIPVVVLTGAGNETIKKKLLEKGVKAYMQKPYDGEALVSTINKILAK